MSLDTLVHNLTTGGVLCAAFRSGFDEGWNSTGEGFNGEYARLSADEYERLATLGSCYLSIPEWRPGCGRDVRKK